MSLVERHHGPMQRRAPRLAGDYPDNLGHTDSPGCFRYHDGEHVTAQVEPISGHCTLCHAVPLVSDPDAPVESPALRSAMLAVQEPDSYRETDLVWEHHLLAGDSRADCHGTAVGALADKRDNRIDFGTDSSSFCANGICHGQEWPEPAQYADLCQPVRLAGGHADALCSGCHNDATLTLSSVTFPSGAQVMDLADQARCMVCHHGGASKVSVDMEGMVRPEAE